MGRKKSARRGLRVAVYLSPDDLEYLDTLPREPKLLPIPGAIRSVIRWAKKKGYGAK